MLPKKSGFFIYILIVFLTFAAFPMDDVTSLNKRNFVEKQAETHYIKQDALLTTKMQLNQIISKLKLQLEVINDSNIEQELLTIKEKNPEIVSITPLKTIDLSFLAENTPLNTDMNPFSLREGLIENGNVKLFVSTSNNMQYQVLLRTDLFSEIIQKQNLRMSTISYIQNSRWKTIPTKYQPKKKLSQGLKKNLPNLEEQANEKGLSHYIENELVIKFKADTDENYIASIAKKYKINIKKRRDKTIIAHCGNKQTQELIVLLEKEQASNGKIEYVEPHFIYLTNEKSNNKLFTPNDILYREYQWNLPSISTEQGWKITKGKENIIIAVIDTGVDLEHPDLKNRLVKGINIIDPKRSPTDDDGHGTHVAGIISANTNNNEGIAGITWYNKIMPVKVLDQSGAGTLFDVAEGIIWATDNGAKVINLSLGNYAESKYLHDAVKYAYSKDVVLIAATGNDNTNELGYPAAYKEVLGISATDPYQNRAPFSNYGDYVDVVAPGVNIPSTYPGNQYAALSGTSMASPHVAALAGLIRSINPKLKNEEILEIIKSTASDLGTPGKDKYYGYGEINIEKAITKAVPHVRSKSIYLQWLRKLLR